MANVPYKLGITNAAGQFWSVIGGVPTIVTTDPIFLSPSIMDWKSLSLNYKRDSVYLGVIRSYSPQQIKFVKDAATILRYIKNTQGGREAVAYLAVYIWNSAAYVYQYLDSWQFNFSQTDNQQFYFQVALMDGGLSRNLKTFATQNYSIVLNDPALAPGLSGQLAPVNTFPLYNTLPADAIPLSYPSSWDSPIAPEVPYLVYMDGIPIISQAEFVTNSLGETLTLLTHSSGSGAETLCTPSLVNSQTLGDYFSQMGTTQSPLANQLVNVMPFTVATTAIFVASQFNKCRMKVAFNMNFTCQHALIGMSDIKCQLVMTITAGTAPAWGALVMPRVVLMEDTVWQAPDTTKTLTWKGESDYFDIQENYIISIGFTYDVPAGTPSTLWPDTHVIITFPPTDVLNPLPVITLKGSFIPDSSVTRAITQFQLFRQLTANIATNGGILPSPMTTDPSTWVKSGLLTTFRTPDAPGNWDNSPTNTLFTSADALRGLTVNTIVDPYFNGGLPFDQMMQPAIYTNMADFAKDLLTDLCAGIGIERTAPGSDKLVAESLYYFFDDDDVNILWDFGTNISNFSMKDWNDYYGSTISIGQSDEQFDSINGPLETLSEVDYALPVVSEVKNIDFKSPYSAAPYQIELYRANIGNKTNTNSSSDNDTLKLQVVDSTSPVLIPVLEDWGSLSGYEPVMSGVVQVNALLLFRGNVISGLPAELLGGEPDFLYSMYNLTFSPQRKALRSLPWLCSNYRGLPSPLIGISGYKKNITLVSDLGSGPVTESNWINVSDTPQTYTPPFSSTPITVEPAIAPLGRSTAAIFKPYLFYFTAPEIPDLPLRMTPPGTPDGGLMYKKAKFTFTRDGIQYPLSGFVYDIGIVPGDKSAYNYVFIASPTCVIPDIL